MWYTYEMKRLPLAVSAVLAALLLSSCATRLAISYDMSPEELIQRAQEASDRNRFEVALQFYEALLIRFSDNPALVVNAMYEIGFIHERRRNFFAARVWLNRVLEQYEAPGGEALPEKFRILAHIVLERVEERDRGRIPTVRQRQQAMMPQPAQQLEEPPQLAWQPHPAEQPQMELHDQHYLYGIDGALARAAEEVSRNLAAMSQVAIVYVSAQDMGTENFIAGGLERVLQERGFAIVSRSSLYTIRAEQGLGIGAVDDYTAARIGYLAGASAVITGRVVGEGYIRQLHLRALDATTGAVIGTASEAF